MKNGSTFFAPVLMVFYLFIFIDTTAQTRLLPAAGPFGGSIYAMAVQGNTLYAGSIMGGLYRTTDMGTSWQQMDLQSDSFSAVMYLMANDSLVFAGVDNSAWATNYLYRSADYGNTWQQVPNLNTVAIAQLPHKILAATSLPATITSSNLSGLVWDTISVFTYQVQVQCMLADGDTAYVGTLYNGIFKSFDEGVTWHQLSNFDSTMGVQHMMMYHHQLYVCGGGITYSPDCGTTWIPITLDGLACTEVACMYDYNDAVWVYGSVTAYYDSAFGIWIQTATPKGGVQVMTSVQGTLFAGATNGVYETTDSAATWSNNERGMLGAQVGCVATNGSALLAGASDKNLSISYDSGATWSIIPGDSNTTLNPTSLYFSNDTIICYDYLPNNPGAISMTTDYGAHWANLEHNLPNTHGYLQFLNKGGRLIAELTLVSSYSLFYSDDWGNTWLPAIGLPSTTFTTLIDVGADIYGSNSTGLYISADRGASWSIVNNFILSNSLQVHCGITYNSKIYLGTDSGMVVSDNGGTTWAATGNFTTLDEITSVFTLNGGLYAGSTYYIYQFDSATNSWPIVGYPYSGLYLYPGVVLGDRYFAGTENGSVYYYGPALSTGIRTPGNTAFGLFPNPAANYFIVNSNQPIQQVRIVDALGRELHRFIPSTANQTQIDISNYSDGLYFVEVTTTEGVSMQQLVISR